MTVLRLASLLWRRGGSRQRATLALTAAGVLASTVLALLVVSVLPALGHRSDRTAWRTPLQGRDVTEHAAVQRTTEDSFRDRTIERIDLAPTSAAASAGTLPVPPGLDRFPAPGEVYASPALAELLRSEPAGELADRYPGELAGTIGPDALAHDEELVVVVGRGAGALDHVDGTDGGSYHRGLAVPIDGFATRDAQVPDGADPARQADAETYRVLAQMAAVLLVVPTVLLIGAASRLTAAQRSQRLAALRLAGATPGTVIALTALEIAGAAAVGVVLGIATYLAVLPLAAHIPLGGGRFPVADLRLAMAVMAGAAVVVPLLAVATAVIALRGVVSGPLQATRRVRPRRPRAIRLLVVPAAWIAFVAAATSMRDGGESLGVLIGLGAVIVTLAVIGPWLTWLVGAVLGGVARGPSTLIAARRITDDPKAAYRTVSGMVLAGLIAGFLFGVLPTIDAAALPEDRETALYLEVPAADVDAVTASLEQRVPGAAAWWDGSASGERPTVPMPETGEVRTGAVVVDGTADIEAARTAVLAASPDADASSPYELGSERILLDDLRRASTVMSVAALLMATAAAGIGGAAALLDQRLTLARLRLVGTPMAVLQRARRWQTLVPLVLASGGAMAFGATAGVVMMGAFGVSDQRIEPPDTTSMLLIGAAAVVAGLGVVAATRPLLVAVSRSTPRD
ncbi:MAG TPA: hypothetical protein VNS19_01615 [Acidimicrobiales bacterium]|nr:hypothetical protein [Acidimicrobiales bacterium]